MIRFRDGFVLQGPAEHMLAGLESDSIHCCVTSPPYWGLRDYGVDGQLGLEATPDEFVDRLVAIFREVRRVLRPDGTCWVNLGDSYATGGKGGGGAFMETRGNGAWKHRESVKGWRSPPAGLKHKDLVGMPWRVAFALQADGWYLRQDIIWHKPSPMPESVSDRCTKAHEYLFLLTTSPRYFYDAEAIREPSTGDDPRLRRSPKDVSRGAMRNSTAKDFGTTRGKVNQPCCNPAGRNRRSVWTIASESYKEAHFATFPTKLVEPCILAGTSAEGCCPECGAPYERITERTKRKRERPNEYVKRNGQAGTGNACANTVAGVDVQTLGWEPTCQCDAGKPVPCTVLDPFLGCGTTALVARRNGCRFVGVELSEEYGELIRKRLEQPLLLKEGVG